MASTHCPEYTQFVEAALDFAETLPLTEANQFAVVDEAVEAWRWADETDPVKAVLAAVKEVL